MDLFTVFACIKHARESKKESYKILVRKEFRNISYRVLRNNWGGQCRMNFDTTSSCMILSFYIEL
jgi:hypothetical protein